MKNIIRKTWHKAILILLDIIVPEDVRLRKLIHTPPAQLYSLLPKSPVNLADAQVLFEYGNSSVKLLLHAFKYKNHPEIKKRFASYLHDEIVEMISEVKLWYGDAPIIVPMPMSKNEKNKKGFNQCEELILELKKLDPTLEVCFDALSKIRETKRQATLSKEERLKNVVHSMCANHQKVKGKNIIVLDDVYTTLSSFTEARRALNEAGAKKVFGVFIAH